MLKGIDHVQRIPINLLINNKHIGLPCNKLIITVRNMTLAERLRHARKAHAKLTQTELAEKSGVSQQTISNIETGIQTESTDIVPLARACGVSSDWLHDGTGSMLVVDLHALDMESAHVLEVMQTSPDYVKAAIFKEADAIAELAARAKANGTGTHG